MFETMLYELKKQKNQKKESFNRALYLKEKDNSSEYNSGECLVDTTGYIPLTELLTRCGLRGIQMPDWKTEDFVSNKFSDNFEVQNEINSVLASAMEKEKENKKNSQTVESVDSINKTGVDSAEKVEK